MRIVLIMFLVFSFLLIGPLASSNATSNSVTYETICVKSGDTVWKIAGQISNDRDDIREKVYLIRQLNNLNNNAQVYPGQVLKVPRNK
ncbi:MAG: yneA [Firmicutes bacterium]|nr:yneA [Bacillota bacterium]